MNSLLQLQKWTKTGDQFLGHRNMWNEVIYLKSNIDILFVLTFFYMSMTMKYQEK